MYICLPDSFIAVVSVYLSASRAFEAFDKGWQINYIYILEGQVIDLAIWVLQHINDRSESLLSNVHGSQKEHCHRGIFALEGLGKSQEVFETCLDTGHVNENYLVGFAFHGFGNRCQSTIFDFKITQFQRYDSISRTL